LRLSTAVEDSRNLREALINYSGCPICARIPTKLLYGTFIRTCKAMQAKHSQVDKTRCGNAKTLFPTTICPKCPIGKKVRENKVIEEFPPFIEIITMDGTKTTLPEIIPQKKVARKPYRKLTTELVIALREETGTVQSIAKKYDINECTLRDVLLRRTWKNV